MNLHLVSACIAALFVSILPAGATSFYIQPFTDFVKAAPNIVRGNLHDIIVENGITADGSKTIYTYATLDIKESIKGSIAAPTIRVRKLGGTRDGMTLEVPSSPEFVESEDTVVFLSEAREDQSYEVWGLELGKFWLQEEGGDFVLKGGILEYDSDPHGNSPHAGATPIPENRRPWTLSQLRELAAASDRGTKSAPSPAVQNNAASPEAKETKQADAPIQHSPDDETTAAEPEAPAPSSGSGWKYLLAAALALGIFYFFKNRG